MASKQFLKRAHDILKMNQIVTGRDGSYGHQFLRRFIIEEDHELYTNKDKQLLLSSLP